jgi:hypothetical protein
MADFTYIKDSRKWQCGNDFTNITLVTFKAPNGVTGCAYSCNMNLDLDGEPQAYGPTTRQHLVQDSLENGGWRKPEKNAELKLQYEAAKLKLEQLRVETKEKEKTYNAIQSTFLLPPTPLSQPKNDKGRTALQEAEAAVRKINPWNKDSIDNGVKIKYYEQKFWQWYGVKALTPDEARRRFYTEKYVGYVRQPVLDKDPKYEDVFGRYPVIQSAFEPGPGFYVSPIPGYLVTRLPAIKNQEYPDWDQRAYSAFDPFAGRPYGALSRLLDKRFDRYNAVKMPFALRDKIFAIRLDTGHTLEFPFLDSGNSEPKVAECSLEAFILLGAKLLPSMYPNYPSNPNPEKFPILYLAFADSAIAPLRYFLAQLADTSNAADFPAMLAFLAQATADGMAAKKNSPKGEPIDEFEKWKKQDPKTRVKPRLYDLINQKLSEVASGPSFTQRVLQRHPSLVGGSGPYLTPPSVP